MTDPAKPYVPQRGDTVLVTRPMVVNHGNGEFVAGEVGGNPLSVSIDNCQLISRADGVPVEGVKDAVSVGYESMLANEINARKAVEIERDDLRKEAEALRTEVAVYKNFVGAFDQAAKDMHLLKEMAADLEQKKINVTFDNAYHVVELLCSAMQIITAKAANYVEMSLSNAIGSAFIVTIKKNTGKTPATMQREAEVERDDLRKQLAEAKADANVQWALITKLCAVEAVTEELSFNNISFYLGLIISARDKLQGQLAEAKANIDEYHALTQKLSDLLRDLANVLRGPPKELSSWGFTGLDQIAATLIAENNEQRATLAKLVEAIRSMIAYDGDPVATPPGNSASVHSLMSAISIGKAVLTDLGLATTFAGADRQDLARHQPPAAVDANSTQPFPEYLKGG